MTRIGQALAMFYDISRAIGRIRPKNRDAGAGVVCALADEDTANKRTNTRRTKCVVEVFVVIYLAAARPSNRRAIAS